MRIESHEYANETNDDVPKPSQSLGTPVPRQKSEKLSCAGANAVDGNTQRLLCNLGTMNIICILLH